MAAMIGPPVIFDRVYCCALRDHMQSLERLRLPLNPFLEGYSRNTSMSVPLVRLYAIQLHDLGSAVPPMQLRPTAAVQISSFSFPAKLAASGPDSTARSLHFPNPQATASRLICARHVAEPCALSEFPEPHSACTAER
jgi:hypothetical protein